VISGARDLMLDRYVAVKLLREITRATKLFRKAFRQKHVRAANLSHPNIVTVHDFGIGEMVLCTSSWSSFLARI